MPIPSPRLRLGPLAGLAALLAGPVHAAPAAEAGKVPAPIEAPEPAAGRPAAAKATGPKPAAAKPAAANPVASKSAPPMPARAGGAAKPATGKAAEAKPSALPLPAGPSAAKPAAPGIDPVRTGALGGEPAKPEPAKPEAPKPAPKAEAPKLEPGIGPVSKLPVPRYVSLKSSQVNLREGPSKDHRAAWVFQRAGLPVEITAEFETWRRVRDSEGVEGWVLHSLLSGRRTALVQPWARPPVAKLAGPGAPPMPTIELRARGAEGAEVTARLEPGVLANVKGCDGRWCRLRGEGFDGYASQEKLWGVYPGEAVE